MSDGRIGNSNQSLQISGVVSAPAYSFASDNDTGIYRIGANNIGIAANGTKVLDISNTAVTITPATTLSAALTYGGVTLSNAVTGTGNMVLSASPTLTGTLTAAAANFSGNVSSATEFRLAQTYLRVATVADAGGWTFGGGYNFAFNSGVGWKHDSTGALSGISFNNAGSIGFFAAGSAAAGTAAAQVATFASNLLTLSQPLNYGGVTLSNSVTGTGSMVLSASPTFTGTTSFPGSTTINSSGNLGIAKTTPANAVQLGNCSILGQDANSFYAGVNFSSAGNYINTNFACQTYWDQSNAATVWRTAPSGTAGNAITFTERMRLDSSGRLGIGMTPSNVLDITQTTNGFAGAQITNSSAGASAYTGYQLNNGTITGGIYLGGTGNPNANIVEVSASGGGSVRIQPTGGSGITQFYTNGSESARFDSSGSFLVGTTTTGGWTTVAKIEGKTATGYGVSGYCTGSGTGVLSRVDTTGGVPLSFYYGASTRISYWSTNGSTSTFNNPSDIRLKTVAETQFDYSGPIKAMQMVDFNWTETGAADFGGLAQQAYEAFADTPIRDVLVSKPKNPEDKWFVAPDYYGRLALWGVKDLYKIIDDLTTRLAALESK